MAETVQIVKKGSPEFKQVQQKYLECFLEAKEEDLLPRGVSDFGEHKGKPLGFTSQQIFDAKLPMPFGCPDLFIQPHIDESNRLTGVIWFCDRTGCICVCCRQDFTQQYPTYCPSRFEQADLGEDYMQDYYDEPEIEDWEEEPW